MDYIPTIIDTMKKQTAAHPDHVLFRFADFDDDTNEWVLEDHAYREIYHKSLDTAYMLRKKRLTARRPGNHLQHAGFRHDLRHLRLHDGRGRLYNHPAAAG